MTPTIFLFGEMLPVIKNIFSPDWMFNAPLIPFYLYTFLQFQTRREIFELLAILRFIVY
jgi:hypothetical protein